MRFAVADYPLMGLAQRRQSQRVGGCSRCHPQNLDVGFKQVGKGAIQPGAQSIAIIGGILMVGFRQGFHHLGVNGSSIIGEKSHKMAMLPTSRRVKIVIAGSAKNVTGFTWSHLLQGQINQAQQITLFDTVISLSATPLKPTGLSIPTRIYSNS